MRRFTSVCAALIVCGATAAAAQEPLDKVKELYVAAAYEDALALASRVDADESEPELLQYQVFCLIALGRSQEAQATIEELISADPLFVLDPAEASPRVQEAFARARNQVLPNIAKKLYMEGRGALERKDREEAIEQFELLLKIVDSGDAPLPVLEEFGVLASGFLDLSRALPEKQPEPPPAATAAPPPAAAAPTAPVVPDVPPVAIQQELPPWFAPDAVSRRNSYSGQVRIRIAADGRVTAAELVRGVHPSYDQRLLRAARSWVYQPARSKNVPVPTEIVVEINLRPAE
jgi:TonB family protein